MFESSKFSFSNDEFDYAETVDLIMEEKQLDLNRPLLSIRRPIQTSESEIKTRSFDSVTNKIVPSSPPVYKSDIKSGPVRNPGTVPFQWEHKPGKPKAESKSDLETHFVPKLPPGRLEFNANQQTKTVSNNVQSLYDDDSDDTYLEATDTLSRSESFFFNCSNVDGLDGPGILVEPFGTLSNDRKTQDLMMGRFLPAAKALTSEPEERPKQNKMKQSPYRFDYSPNQQEEDGSNISNIASSVCGLAPHICLRSSFGLLNPIPAVRLQAQRAVSVRRMRSKYQDSTTSDQKQNNETVNESVSQEPSLSTEEKEKLSADSRSKISKNFGELLAIDENPWKPSSEDLVAEKTLYVDTIHSIDKKVQEESKNHSQDVETLIGGDSEVEECCDQEITKEKIDLESSKIHYHHIVHTPPLPKAPSDSWLKRTLPTIPSKNNSFTWLQSLGSDNNNHNFTKIQANSKWESIVKTSNTNQGFLCFSKEALNPIPEA